MFLNNHVADGLCTAIAEDFQVPFEHERPMADIDTRAAYIRARLASVRELWFSIAESDYLYSVKPEESQEEQPAKKAKVEVTEAASKHTILKFAPSRWACSERFTTTNPMQPTSLQYWLASSCMKLPRPPGAHLSHHYFKRGSLHVCLRCGAHSEGGTRVVRLKRPCAPPSQTQWLKDNQFTAYIWNVAWFFQVTQVWLPFF